MARETPMDVLSKELVRYQRPALFLFYPSLIGFMSAIIGAFNKDYDYALAYSSERTLMMALRANPVAGNLGLSLFLGVLITALFGVAFGYLTFRAAKVKLWATIVAIAFYFVDAIYGSLLIIPSFPYAMSLLTYLTNLIVHLAFLGVYAYVLVRYGKLKRLERKLQGK